MKPPEIVNATRAELDELLAKAKPVFSSEQYLLLERVFGTFVYVLLSLQNAKTSIKRFRRMLFGGRTEYKREVLERATGAEAQAQGGVGNDVGNDVGRGPGPVSSDRGRCSGRLTDPDLILTRSCPSEPSEACDG